MLTHIPKRVPSDPVDRTGRVQAFISMVRGPRQALLVGVLAAAVILTGVVGLFVARQQTSRGNHAVEHHWHAISEMVEILAPAWSQVWADGLPMLLVALAATLAVALLWTRRDRRHLEDQVALDRERQVVAARVAEERELYLVTLQSIGDGVVATDAQGNVTLLNDVAERLTGWSRDDATGRPIGQVFRVIHETTRQPCENPVERVLQSGRLIGTANHTALLCRDGSEFSITDSGAPIRDAAGTVLGVVLVFRDITEQKRSEERFHRATVHAPFPIMLAAGDGEILEINETWARLSGYGRSDVGTVQDWMRHTLGEAHAEAVLSQESDGAGAIPDGELEIHTRVGESRYWSFNSALAGPVPDGRPSIVTMALDVTSHREAELRLRQSEKLESIGLLAGGVAHDFNNMLNVILGRTEMAMQQAGSNAPINNHLLEIRKAAERSANMTRQLLAFARKQTVSPKVLDLNETVEAMLRMLRQLMGEDIQLAWLPGPNLWPVKIDPSQVDQILANLCVNARDAITGVGRVTIATENVNFAEDYGSSHMECIPGDYAMLAVSDNGCGMSREILDKLFEPYFTTKGVGKGTGLGLATIYGIIKQNNGFINVYSELGKGTTFKIYLQRHTAGTDQAEEEDHQEYNYEGSETVLIVEDEPSILSLCRIMLESYGYRVFTAGTPGEALHLAGEHTGKINLLITDVIMPEMNGRDLAMKLLTLYPDIKRLFMSGYPANVIAHHGVLDEGVYFIQKPFSGKNLAEKVRAALDQK